MDDVFADPLGPASGLALVDGDAEVDVARLVVSHLPGKGGPGLKIFNFLYSQSIPITYVSF